MGGCGNARNGGYVGPVEVITSEDKPVSRYEAGMMDKLAAKDSEIALLKSNTYTDQKLADVYDRLLTIINRNKEAQGEINLNQAVYNGTNTATLGCMKQQIADDSLKQEVEKWNQETSLVSQLMGRIDGRQARKHAWMFLF